LRPIGICLAVVAVLSAGVEACFIRPWIPRPYPISMRPVELSEQTVTVDVVDQLAVKSFECTFRNPNSYRFAGGTCYLEIEAGAQIDNLCLEVGGKTLRGEILDAEKAKKIFQEMVRQGSSPALLEYYGQQMVRVDVPHIPANGTVVVKLKYTMPLIAKGGVVRLQIPNTNPKGLVTPLKQADITVNIKSKTPLKNIYSPSHEIKIGEKKDWDVSVRWSARDHTPKHPFVLLYQTTPQQLGASLVAHRDRNEDGTFMLMLSPTIGNGVGKIQDAEILPKDVIFCVDVSGSMQEQNKMEQAKAALKYCVETLRPGDRFNIVDFNSTARQFRTETLVEATAAHRQAGMKHADELFARGGTNILEALELSLKLLGKSDRLKMIVFATDGLPTIGEQNVDAILKGVAGANQQNVRMFVFGEGFDVNTRLLDFLAINHQGEADYILPSEDIGKKIGAFFDRVGAPVLTDARLEFDGIKVSDVYPAKVSALFRGEQVIVYGRYSGHGSKKVRLTGIGAKGEKKTYEYTLEFPEISSSEVNGFVPRLWAGRKIDFLLNELRKADKPSKEIIDEVAQLAKRFGIVTPYTSYLVVDDTPRTLTRPTPIGPNPIIPLPRPIFRPGRGYGNAAGQEQLNRALKSSREAKPGSASPQLVQGAKKQADLRDRITRGSGGFAALDKSAHDYQQLEKGQGERKTSTRRLQYVGTRTFYQQDEGSFWIESKYAGGTSEPKRVAVGSEEYFQLLERNPDLAKVFALGRVVVEIQGQWYQLESSSKLEK